MENLQILAEVASVHHALDAVRPVLQVFANGNLEISGYNAVWTVDHRNARGNFCTVDFAFTVPRASYVIKLQVPVNKLLGLDDKHVEAKLSVGSASQTLSCNVEIQSNNVIITTEVIHMMEHKKTGRHRGMPCRPVGSFHRTYYCRCDPWFRCLGLGKLEFFVDGQSFHTFSIGIRNQQNRGRGMKLK